MRYIFPHFPRNQLYLSLSNFNLYHARLPIKAHGGTPFVPLAVKISNNALEPTADVFEIEYDYKFTFSLIW
ncbi:MAG: hypothetical protein H0V14_09225 [Chitinophagaceae bacterium]|nr:hypothetical protein [Chitinophagaceae bacterium]